jgi:energy-coupling factor transporter transmembrane protein EcfT
LQTESGIEGYEPSRHARLQAKGLTLMSIVVCLLIAAFLARVVVVYMQQLFTTLNFGDSIYLGVGTLLSESAGCALIIFVAWLSFYRSAAGFKKHLSQRMLHNSTLCTNESQIPARYGDY